MNKLKSLRLLFVSSLLFIGLIFYLNSDLKSRKDIERENVQTYFNLQKSLRIIDNSIEQGIGEPFTKGILAFRIGSKKELEVIVNSGIWEYNFDEDSKLQRRWESLTGEPYGVVYLDSDHLRIYGRNNGT